jgi:hypothetical protein
MMRRGQQADVNQALCEAPSEVHAAMKRKQERARQKAMGSAQGFSNMTRGMLVNL